MQTAMSPAIAASRAWRSESLPSVAETSVRSIVSNLTGRAPVWSTSARFFASPSDAIPVISAPPAVGSIPSGYCW